MNQYADSGFLEVHGTEGVYRGGKCEFSQSPSEGSEDCEPSMKSIIDGGEDLMGNRFMLTSKDITVINTMSPRDGDHS